MYKVLDLTNFKNVYIKTFINSRFLCVAVKVRAVILLITD